MIVLDTHIWIWWVHGDAQLPPTYATYLIEHEPTGLGVSAISLWEVAKLVEHGRLTLPIPLRDWLDQASTYPGVVILPLTPAIVVESTTLPGTFHKDPADQIIVATARVEACPLITVDGKIRQYPYVDCQPQ